MAIDFAALVYLQCQDTFGRDVAITPLTSAPGASTYTARGIYGTRAIEIPTDMGMAIISDQETILDVLDNDFLTAGRAVPRQGDLITIPAEGNIPAAGDFEVTDASSNGGGETTLTIRKYEPAEP